jgi:hypothetical protein
VVYCSRCGKELGSEDLFCSKCGVRTPRGRDEVAQIPLEDMFSQVGRDLKEAFGQAAREIEKGLEGARIEIMRSTGRGPQCRKCGETSRADA